MLDAKAPNQSIGLAERARGIRGLLSMCAISGYQSHIYCGNLRVFFLTVLRQGKARISYWRFFLSAAARYRHSLGAAMTVAVMGYHFQTMTALFFEAGVRLDFFSRQMATYRNTHARKFRQGVRQPA